MGCTGGLCARSHLIYPGLRHEDWAFQTFGEEEVAMSINVVQDILGWPQQAAKRANRE